jgi:hypothetical protein
MKWYFGGGCSQVAEHTFKAVGPSEILTHQKFARKIGFVEEICKN